MAQSKNDRRVAPTEARAKLARLERQRTDLAGCLDALLAAVNNRVRFDAAQSLTVSEQLQARSNIGAVAASDVGNTDTDFVAVFVGALV